MAEFESHRDQWVKYRSGRSGDILEFYVDEYGITSFTEELLHSLLMESEWDWDLVEPGS